MSNNIDERIVEMRFDNKQFESGVQTSIKSLDDLKKGLDLDASAKSLSNLDRVGKSFSLAGIAAGVDSLADRFSSLGIIGMTALQNLTNAAINAGSRMVSAITAPMKTGFSEYETKMNAIQTILTNTQGGQTKITQGAISSAKQSSQAAVDSIREANDQALDDLRKNYDQRLKEQQKLADNELKTVEDKYDKEADALKKVQDQELKEYEKRSNEELKVLDNQYESATDLLKKMQDNELDTYQRRADNELDILKDKYDKESDALDKALTKENEDLRKAHNEKLDMYEDEYMSKLKSIDEERYNKIKAIDDEIKSINALTKEEQDKIDKQKEAAKLSELQAKVDGATSAEDRMAASKELADYTAELSRKQTLREREDKIDTLKLSKETINDEYDKKKELLKTEYADKKDSENELYRISLANIKQEYEERSKNLKKTYDDERDSIKERQTLEKEAIKELYDERIKNLKSAHDDEKENIKERQDLEKQAIKEQQDEKIKSLRTTYETEKDFIKDRLSAEKDAIKEKEDAEIDAINRSNKAALKSAGSSLGGGSTLTGELTKGSTLEDVTKALDELNTYSDKTIYNFAEMARNIGTFTAAGVDLQTSVTSIKGIANLAAGSGSSAQQASTAMYQLSQAIASGSVKLQDWNSVVNAGMGGQLFQRALEKTAAELGHGRDMSVSFRDSLESGWITTEVLTKTLEKFANDESLIKAATQVKTFTQLMDTMKESAQSGWAKSWEYIVGDKDEAVSFFTAVNDSLGGLINASSDARNSMLKFWHDNGGRAAVVEAITNAFNGLMSILKPIHEAFIEVFPPATGEALVAFSKGLRDLTAHFKMGDEAAGNLKSTFKGLFAIVDLGIDSLKFVAKGISSVISLLLPGTGGLGEAILSATGGIGNFIISIRDTVEANKLFEKGLESIKYIISSIKDLLGSMGSVIVNAFDKADATLEPYITSMKDAIETTTIFSDVNAKLHGSFKWIGDELSKAQPILEKAGTFIKDTFGPAIAFLGDKLKSITLSDVGNILGGIGAFFLGKSVKDLLGSFQDVTKGFNGVIEGISGSLEAFQTKLKAEALLKIGMAIGILAASIVALSMIDQESLTKALYALTVAFTELSAALFVLQKVSFAATGLSTTLLSLGTAILLISIAMSKMSKIDSEGLSRGVEGLAAILTTLAIFTKVTSNTTGIQSSMMGLIGLSVGVLILASAVEKFGSIDKEALDKGIQGVGASLAALALFIKVIGNPETMISTGIGITAIAIAMNIFAKAVEAFGNLPIGTLIQGISGVAAALMSITLMMKLLPNDASMIATGVGLNLMAVALYGIAGAVAIFGHMSLETLAVGIGGLAAALTVMALTAKLMTGALAGAAAMTVMAIAINLLVPAIALLGLMDLKSIGIALVAIAGVFAILGLSALVLAPLAPVILSLAGSIALLGVGVFGIGAGLVAMSVGLAAIAAGGTAFGYALIALVKMILDAVPDLCDKIGKALEALIKMVLNVLDNMLEPFVESVLKVLMAVLKKLNEYVEPITEVAMKIINAFLRVVANNIQEFVEAAIDVMVAFLRAIVNKIPDVIDVAMDIVEALITGIGSMADRFINAGFQLIIDFINGLAATVRTQTPILVDAFVNLSMAIIEGICVGLFSGIKTTLIAIKDVGAALINGFKDMLGIHSPSKVFEELGIYTLLGFINGITSKISDLTTTITDIVTNMVSAISNRVSEFLESGKTLFNNFIDGIKDRTGDILTAISTIVSNMITGISDRTKDFIEVGKNVINGFISGLQSKIAEVANSAANLAKSALDAAKNALGIHSPSREFAEVGKYSAEGFAQGLTNFSDKVVSSATDMGNIAVSALSDAISNISDVVNGRMDTSPVIRPVLDLSDVEAGGQRINSLFAQRRGINVDSIDSKIPTIGRNTSTNDTTDTSTGTSKSTSINFVQNNYSPKPLSRLEIYRQTKNQISTMKGLVTT